MNSKISIYQLLPRLFGNYNETCVVDGNIHENGCGKFADISKEVLASIKEMGYTHIWFTGVVEHATQTQFSPTIYADHPAVVKGKAGSPYAIKDYYDVAPALSVDIEQRMKEFEVMVAGCHQAGLQVLIDFVPNHVSRVYHSDSKPPYIVDFGKEDNTGTAYAIDNNFYYLPMQPLQIAYEVRKDGIPYCEFPARATGNNCFSASPSPNDWYETVKLNYGIDYMGHTERPQGYIPDTWHKMLDILRYWTTKGVDGFRCDMAEMVPTDFWTWAISQVKAEWSEILFVAEIYQPHLYKEYIESGFDLLYDKVGLYDALIGVLKDGRDTHTITTAWQSTESVDRTRLLHFVETHDEQRLASDFIAGDAYKAFPAMVVSALIDSGAILTYFGQELGERGMDEEGFSGRDGRTTIFDYWSLTSMREWMGEDKSFDLSNLSKTTRVLRNSYKTLLQIATRYDVFGDTPFFDLMYANPTLYRQFAFLRGSGSRFALVCVNFSPDPIPSLTIEIPDHAYATLGLDYRGVYRVEELVTGKVGLASLANCKTWQCCLEGYGYAVYLFDAKA